LAKKIKEGISGYYPDRFKKRTYVAAMLHPYSYALAFSRDYFV
jgi:hypothetical protein